MSDEVNCDNGTQTHFVSTLSIELKSIDENGVEFTRNETHLGKSVVVTFKPKRTGESEHTAARTDDNSLEAKLKQERSGLIQHLYNIIDTSRRPTSNSDSNPGNYCLDNSENDFADRWANSYDYDLKFCGRKTSEFGSRKCAQYNCKTSKQILKNCDANRFSLRARQKKASRNGFYSKRKKELVLTRKADSVEKFESFRLQNARLETEYQEGIMDEIMERNDEWPIEFTLRDENAPDHLQSDVLDFLLGLQDREITPEDYEFLLRLDESVPKKTISEDRIAGLETQIATELHVSETCGVCMESYVVGETRKVLPCGHVFHACCIETWLRHNSTRCPLDNKEV